MANITTFQDLIVWQKAHQLVLLTYSITKNFSKEETFALTNQARRASASIPANIVEGFRRRFLKDSLNFYRIADASLEELKYHLLLAHDLKYIGDKEYELFLEKSNETGRLLTGWIKSQKNLNA